MLEKKRMLLLCNFVRCWKLNIKIPAFDIDAPYSFIAKPSEMVLGRKVIENILDQNKDLQPNKLKISEMLQHVSKKHCKLLFSEKNDDLAFCKIQDLNSTNGTSIVVRNQQRVILEENSEYNIFLQSKQNSPMNLSQCMLLLTCEKVMHDTINSEE